MQDCFQSQYEQDKYLEKYFFSNKKNGVFVDIGAHDGITFSNTYYYEKCLGWNGLCIEPNPNVIDSLRNNRKCTVIEGCALDKNCSKTFRIFEGEGQYEMVSGLVDYYSEEHSSFVDDQKFSHLLKSSKNIIVNCYNTSQLLIENGFTIIDFISIDVEGCEYEIIKSLDFSKIEISVILVENQYDNQNIRDFLLNKNYIYMGKLHVDDLFVLRGTYFY